MPKNLNFYFTQYLILPGSPLGKHQLPFPVPAFSLFKVFGIFRNILMLLGNIEELIPKHYEQAFITS